MNNEQFLRNKVNFQNVNLTVEGLYNLVKNNSIKNIWVGKPKAKYLKAIFGQTPTPSFHFEAETLRGLHTYECIYARDFLGTLVMYIDGAKLKGITPYQQLNANQKRFFDNSFVNCWITWYEPKKEATNE